MHGQTNKHVLSARLQRELRKQPTDAERRLWLHLRGKQLLGFKFRRQHPYEACILDFVCMEVRLAIEVDGSQHLESTKDVERDEFLADAGFRVLRFWNHEVLGNTSAVLEAIVAALSEQTLKQNHPHPSPPLEGEGVQQVPNERRSES